MRDLNTGRSHPANHTSFAWPLFGLRRCRWPLFPLSSASNRPLNLATHRAATRSPPHQASATPPHHPPPPVCMPRCHAAACNARACIARLFYTMGSILADGGGRRPGPSAAGPGLFGDEGHAGGRDGRHQHLAYPPATAHTARVRPVRPAPLPRPPAGGGGRAARVTRAAERRGGVDGRCGRREAPVHRARPVAVMITFVRAGAGGGRRAELEDDID